MPCGVHVRSDEPKDDSKDNTEVSKSWSEGDDSVEYVKISLDGGRNTNTTEKSSDIITTTQDTDSTIKHSDDKISEGEVDVEEEVNVEEGGDVEEAGGNVEEAGGDVEEAGGDVEEAGGDVEEAGGDVEEEEDGDAGVAVEDDNDDRHLEIDSVDNNDVRDQLKNQKRPHAVTKVMIGYLLNARNQLYEKIRKFDDFRMFPMIIILQ
jgi:hypothetical protein